MSLRVIGRASTVALVPMWVLVGTVEVQLDAGAIWPQPDCADGLIHCFRACA